ncbi:DNA-directed RNA polymerase specialized sigma subunit [Fructobacillus fructosus]|uniref:hypothetical protein n=1 Tax=Fructobacillus fructosus TaxID=1631 RepID=UPI00021954B5|nr:hypothetical protein [Fructobacillus fructosus]KRN52428.1 ComX [Fructobacillus fructosus KCTC 3544]CAK1234951.1 DNA-directed RNA polymerase specialized sigma subunit [Fructobacillus fructosus]CAK1239797.1 DNA-directed RNA polymerase specialized sigma subunit [Fructobacillus fructosus]CAK1240418.1 DNA-directed RNA polymerase specialized sigma subunit [Fructobacillus fructosus]CAK1240451.1 DNA-directed RNA polymerase specialized sigma subunit [Fructobacillus fructosus]
MNRDPLLPAVIAAQRGHECAYCFLQRATRGLVGKVYQEQLSGRYRFDDWEADALVSLINSVRCFALIERSARFSTYYTQSLLNRSRDIKRKAMSHKGRAAAEMLSFDESPSLGQTLVTDSFNPEQILLVKEALRDIRFRRGKGYAHGVSKLVGLQPLKKHLDAKEARRMQQVQYHFKKTVYRALKEE